jgi:hypothetical protein
MEISMCIMRSTRRAWGIQSAANIGIVISSLFGEVAGRRARRKGIYKLQAKKQFTLSWIPRFEIELFIDNDMLFFCSR